MPVAKVYQAEAGKREGIRLPPQAFVALDGERIGAGHLGAVCRVRRPGWRGAYYSASVTLFEVEPGRSPARRSRFWALIGWCGGMLFSVGAAGGVGAKLWSAGGARGLVGRRARPAGRYPRGDVGLRWEVRALESLEQ